MSQAEELLNSLVNEEASTYHAGTGDDERHIVIGRDRFIIVPECLKKIGVESDHDVETVTFDCPRYWDKLDLSEMKIYVNYMRADGYKDKDACINVVVDSTDDSVIHFDWAISSQATAVKGPLSFLVNFRKTDTNGKLKRSWHSELNTDMYISEGMECDESVLSEYPDIITYLLERMDTVEGSAIVATGEEILALRSRLDNMAKLQEGSTTGDAELIDGRVDYAGKTWDNLGAHVRGVTKQISSEIDELLVDMERIFPGNETGTMVPVDFDNVHESTIILANGNLSSNTYTKNYTVCAKSRLPKGRYRITGFTENNACLYVLKNLSGDVIDYKDVSSFDDYGTKTVDVNITEIGCTIYIGGFITSTPALLLYDFEKRLNDELLSKGSRLYGKKISVNGTSISYGAGYDGGYMPLITNKYNMVLENVAKNGGTIADLSGRYPDRHCVGTTIDDMAEDADYIIIEGGYNDWYLWTKIGVMSETMTSTIDTTTFYGGLESICRQALKKWKGKKIGFIITHKINDAWRTQHQEGSKIYPTLDGYYQAIRDVCEKYSIPYLDLSKTSRLNTEMDEYKEYTFNGDGIHPNKEGYEMFYVPHIERWLETI